MIPLEPRLVGYYIYHPSLLLRFFFFNNKMLLQAAAAAAAISSPLHPTPLFSSKSFYSQTQLGFHRPLHRNNGNRNISITCTSTSQDHNTVDLEVKPSFQWKDLLSLGSATVLSQWEEEGRQLTHEELQLCVKAMKKYRKYKLALEVYEWMNDQGDRFRLSYSDIASQLDLISKVQGISSAEEYFLNLPESSKNNLLYGALLNAYVQAEKIEKAESLFEEIRDKGYATCSLPFNSMMTLYTKLKEYEKLMALIVEMLEKNVQLDISSYNIWITACGELHSTEKMEQAVEWMKLDSTCNPNWSTYNAMASVYIKLDQTEKAQDCLKEVENRITGGERMPYIYLLTLYSTLGKKEDVYRIWNTYKSNFPDSLSLGYKAMIAALLMLNDMEGAEKILEESNNPKLRSLLFHQSMTNKLLGKTSDLLDEHVDGANPMTWESLALGYIANKKIPMALSCLTKATTAEGAANWQPRPKTIDAFNLACDQESDSKSKDLLLKVLGKVK